MAQRSLRDLFAGLGGKGGSFARNLGISLGVVGLIVLVFETFTVRISPGEIGVRQNNLAGGIEPTDLDVGYHLSIPGVHRIYRVDSRYFFLNFAESDDLGEEYEPLLIRTEGNNNVIVDCTIPTRIVPGRAHELVAEGLLVGEAYKVQMLAGYKPTAAELFAMATRGNARRLRIGHETGSIEVGKFVDLVVLDPAATPVLASRQEVSTSLEDVLFSLMILGDDRAVRATYVAGERVHARLTA